MIVDRVAGEEEAALFGTEDKDEAHHDGEAGFVEVGRFDLAQQLATAIVVGLVERLHQHFDGAFYLFAECIGNLLLMFERLFEHRFESRPGGTEAAAHTEERLEGLEGQRFEEPETRMPRDGAGGGAGGGVDELPLGTVGDESEADIMCTAEERQAFVQRCRPGVVEIGRGERGAGWGDLDEEARLPALRCGDDQIGGKGEVLLRRRDGGECALPGRGRVERVGIILKQHGENQIDPGAVQLRELRVVALHSLRPLIIGLPELPPVVGCNCLEPLRKNTLQRSDREKGAGGFQQ